MVVDLRVNSGGSELWAARIAAMFCTKNDAMYAASLSRSGRKHDDLDQHRPCVSSNQGKGLPSRPVVCLVGPGCVSSGEALPK